MLWQYRLWMFKSGDKKLERFLTKNPLLNFENWCSGKLSKIRHHFINKQVVLELMLLRNVNNKKMGS